MRCTPYQLSQWEVCIFILSFSWLYEGKIMHCLYLQSIKSDHRRYINYMLLWPLKGLARDTHRENTGGIMIHQIRSDGHLAHHSIMSLSTTNIWVICKENRTQNSIMDRNIMPCEASMMLTTRQSFKIAILLVKQLAKKVPKQCLVRKTDWISMANSNHHSNLASTS